MKKVIIIVFIFLLNINLCFAQKDYAKPFETQQPAQWSGSGWLLNKGYIATNHHVAENARTIKVKFPKTDGSWNEYYAETIAMDETNDLALLKIVDTQFSTSYTLPYSVRTTLADVGESIFVLGYPLISTMGDEIKLTTGIVSSLSGYEGSRVQYQISAPVQPGNSGGPVFDEQGNVIAIVTAKHTGAENVSYAVKTSYLQALINTLSLPSEILPASNTLKGKSLPEQVKLISNRICFINCSSRGETPRSSTPKYGTPVIPQGEKVVSTPYIDYCNTSHVRIQKISISDDCTIIEMKCNNETTNGYIQWMGIKADTYLFDGEKKYKLIKTEGIAILPDKTTFSHAGESKIFKLIFPAIPKGRTSIDLIEPGGDGWRYYGISLKEY